MNCRLHWICPNCMNAILDHEAVVTQLDLGTIRVLDEKLHLCEIAEVKMVKELVESNNIYFVGCKVYGDIANYNV